MDLIPGRGYWIFPGKVADFDSVTWAGQGWFREGFIVKNTVERQKTTFRLKDLTHSVESSLLQSRVAKVVR